MAVEQALRDRNRESRERMESLVAGLSDDQLGRRLGDGRSIATILGHTAFWDQRVLVLLRRWMEGKDTPSREDEEPEDVDWINDSVHPFHLLLPPRQLAQFAVDTAGEVDALVEEVADDLIQAIEAAGNPIGLDRANHRVEHLDEIEQILSEF